MIKKETQCLLDLFRFWKQHIPTRKLYFLIFLYYKTTYDITNKVQGKPHRMLPISAMFYYHPPGDFLAWSKDSSFPLEYIMWSSEITFASPNSHLFRVMKGKLMLLVTQTLLAWMWHTLILLSLTDKWSISKVDTYTIIPAVNFLTLGRHPVSDAYWGISRSANFLILCASHNVTDYKDTCSGT